MNKKDFKYIYGPVFSWRLGISLGIDLVSQENKICNFNCIYCQLGETSTYTNEKRLYVPTEGIIRELKLLPKVKIDYITFSGRGEPTLAKNLGQAIKAIKKIRREPVAVLTNSGLIDKKEVREDLSLADFVIAKLDVYSQESLKKINRPAKGSVFGNILKGLEQFRKDYHGRLALQIMFVEENKNKTEDFINLVNHIKPDEVQINTPLRPCNIKPLSKLEILKIKINFIKKCKSLFKGKKINIISVYDTKKYKKSSSFSNEATLKRRGKVF